MGGGYDESGDFLNGGYALFYGGPLVGVKDEGLGEERAVSFEVGRGEDQFMDRFTDLSLLTNDFVVVSPSEGKGCQLQNCLSLDFHLALVSEPKGHPHSYLHQDAPQRPHVHAAEARRAIGGVVQRTEHLRRHIFGGDGLVEGVLRPVVALWRRGKRIRSQ